MTATHSLSELDRLQQLAERYARYGRSAGGLSSVLGGSLCLLVFAVALTANPATGLRLVLAAAPLLWLIGKELLRRYYYQSAGAVGQKLSATEHRMHRWLTAFVVAVSVAIIGFALQQKGLAGLLALPWPKLGYFVLVLLMPIVVWRWLWSSSDFIVGVCLICQAAVIIAGGNYKLNLLGAYLICTGLLAIGLGIKEHRDYLQLRRELGLNDVPRVANA